MQLELDIHRDRDLYIHSSSKLGPSIDLQEYRELQVLLTLHLGRCMHHQEEPTSEERLHEREGFLVRYQTVQDLLDAQKYLPGGSADLNQNDRQNV